MKQKVFVPDDGLLFSGFADAVQTGWEKSAYKTIKTYIAEQIKADRQKYLPEDVKKIIGESPNLKSKKARLLIQLMANAVVLKQSDVRKDYHKPQEILEKSYEVLQDYGFSKEATFGMSDIGNGEFLRQYSKAAEETLSLTKDGRIFLDAFTTVPFRQI